MSNLRVPPQNTEAEKHVVGAMLLSEEAVAVAMDKLHGEDFYLDKNRAIFDAICTLSQSGAKPDVLTLAEYLKKSGNLDRAGGEEYLMEVTAEVWSASSIESHTKIVSDKAALRGLIAVSMASVELAYSNGADAATGLETALNGLMRISEKNTPSGLVPWLEAVHQALDHWGKIAAGQVQGVLTGLPDYDAIIGGFLPSQLHLLGGRPSMGKSAFVLQIAKQAGKTAFFSLESITREQIERAMAQECGIHANDFRSSEGVNRNKDKIAMYAPIISGYTIWINDTTTTNVQQIHAQCRRLKAREGLDFVIVDYLQLVQSVGKHERREREIGSISESLKRMANDLNVPVLAIASLSRDCERREDKRPQMSDFRESGSLESDAHTITTLYRESKYKKNCPEDFKDVTEISVLKNKNGPTGRAPHLFEGSKFRFVSMDKNTIARYKQYVDGKDAESFTEGVPGYGTR